ncbi:MAG: bifunctional folylpolyglutamate synthase/dihydrofolate synthase [Lachnospiraceae bacterium]|nr:bifunctional folylpolyglutamate synthase/dihydrofolate synthase [Lachnospiraceae bacterium]
MTIVTYEEICAYIYGIPKFAEKNDLGHTRELLTRLGISEQEFQIFHVAGSNGKGSVCAFLNQALLAADCPTGMFTSPHLVCMEERFVANGVRCTREEFAACFYEVFDVVQQMRAEGLAHPSFFEYLFAMGMCFFRKKQVRYLVLETGLGGRLDATNVFEKKLLTIITSISLEHTEYLGDTIADIAGEKAGIIRENVPLVFDASCEEAAGVLRRAAKRKQAPCYGISYEKIKFHANDGKYIDFSYSDGYDEVELKIPFPAVYQMMNAALAYRALSLVRDQIGLTGEEIAAAMRETKWPGRMQAVTPEIYFDGAHNADAVEQLVHSVKQLETEKPILLFAMMREKDYRTAIRSLCRQIAWEQVIVTRVADERGLDTKTLREEFEKNGQRVTEKPDSQSAYAYAVEQKRAGQLLFCAGSLYFIGELERIVEGDQND